MKKTIVVLFILSIFLFACNVDVESKKEDRSAKEDRAAWQIALKYSELIKECIYRNRTLNTIDPVCEKILENSEISLLE